METKVLENVIIKLGYLLALGFGEAGSEIIASNLDEDSAEVNAMVPGSKVEAIYGFCEIRNFATATSVLQERTMVFVNQVVEIVRTVVDSYLGAANKNVGEAFLMVWRLNLYYPEAKEKIADLAVLSFVQVVAELNRSRQLAEYRDHPAILAKIPDFRVSLGFGLHLGWAIEGAIGSEFKIDASYLSPHVNIANQLSAATIGYGTTILMSEPLARACHPGFRFHFRPVDRVKLSGSTVPTRLFTVDLYVQVLKIEGNFASIIRKNRRIQERSNREARLRKVLHPSFQASGFFESDATIKSMREPFPLEFFQEFERGYLNYEAGEWDVAAISFRRACERLSRTETRCSSYFPEDGPSQALLGYMATYNFQAPSDWKGWRELAER